MIDATFFAGVNTAFKLSDFATHTWIAEVPHENKAFVRSIERVRLDLEDCQRLFHNSWINQYLQSRELEKYNWIEDVVKGCYIALSEIGLYFESVRAGEEREGSVSFFSRVRSVLNDQGKLENKRSELWICHQSLSNILSYLHGLQRQLENMAKRPKSRSSQDGLPRANSASEQDLDSTLPSYQDVVRQKIDIWTPNSRRNRHSKARSSIDGSGTDIDTAGRDKTPQVLQDLLMDDNEAKLSGQLSEKLPWPLNETSRTRGTFATAVTVQPVTVQRGNLYHEAPEDDMSRRPDVEDQTENAEVARPCAYSPQAVGMAQQKGLGRERSTHLSSNVKGPIDPFEFWFEKLRTTSEVQKVPEDTGSTPSLDVYGLDATERQRQVHGFASCKSAGSPHRGYHPVLPELDGNEIRSSTRERGLDAELPLKSPRNELSPPLAPASISRPRSVQELPCQTQGVMRMGTNSTEIPPVLRPAFGNSQRSRSDSVGTSEDMQRQKERVKSCSGLEGVCSVDNLAVPGGALPARGTTTTERSVQPVSKEAIRRQRRKAAMDAALGL